jgi:hypothetical protein
VYLVEYQSTAAMGVEKRLGFVQVTPDAWQFTVEGGDISQAVSICWLQAGRSAMPIV